MNTLRGITGKAISKSWAGEASARCSVSPTQLFKTQLNRAVAQLVARIVRDDEAAGSSPASPIELSDLN